MTTLRRFALLSIASILLAGLASRPATAGDYVVFDFEQPYFSEYPLRIKDHTLVRKNGLYHLFYIRDTDEDDFGHATSADLVHWTIQEPVLWTGPDPWDGNQIWAPAIFEMQPDVWWMFYTGVNQYFSQQAGIAFSFDLWEWFKYNQNPVYRPDDTWAVWTEDNWANCRDPDVFWYNDQWNMVNTAFHNWGKGAVSHAVSTDLFQWTDDQWIYRHNTYHVLESCQIEMAGGLFHLFFTDEGVPGTSLMSAVDLDGPYDINQRIVIDRGHAPEVDEFVAGINIFSRHAAYYDGQGSYQYVIGFDTLEMNATTPYVVPTLRITPEWQILEGTAFTFQPTFRNNPAYRGENIDPNFAGDSWISTYEFFQGPLGAGYPGGSQGTSPQGAIRSQGFTLQGNSINFLIGGGSLPNQCYLALVDEATGVWLRRETGNGSYEMVRKSWDVRDLKGRDVYFVIADSSSGADGYINVDDIRESSTIVEFEPIGIVNPGRSRKDIHSAESQEPDPDPRSAPHGFDLGNEPNPFNPTTQLVYTLAVPSEVRVRIYDARGGLVRELWRGTARSGRNRVVWDGTDGRGRPVSSGVYFFALDVNGRPVGRHKMTLVK